MKKIVLALSVVMSLGLVSCSYVNKAKALVGLDGDKTEELAEDEEIDWDEIEAVEVEEVNPYDYYSAPTEDVNTMGESDPYYGEEVDDYYGSYEYDYNY